MDSLILDIVVCALLTGFAAQVVSEDKITAPLRQWIFGRGWTHYPSISATRLEDGLVTTRPGWDHQHWFWRFLGGVVECYRCSGVWLSLPATMIVLGRLPHTHGWSGFREFIVVWFASSFLQFAVATFVMAAQRDDEATVININGLDTKETTHGKKAD